MKAKVLFLVLLLGGCAGQTALNTADTIGAANLAITTIATTLQTACGNTVPDGPCQTNAVVDRDVMDRAKLELKTAASLLDAAAVNTNVSDAWTAIAAAQRIIAQLEVILTDRGINP